MDASYKIQRGIHVHLIQFFMCPEFWVHIIASPDLLSGNNISITIKFFTTITIFSIEDHCSVVICS